MRKIAKIFLVVFTLAMLVVTLYSCTLSCKDSNGQMTPCKHYSRIEPKFHDGQLVYMLDGAVSATVVGVSDYNCYNMQQHMLTEIVYSVAYQTTIGEIKTVCVKESLLSSVPKHNL